MKEIVILLLLFCATCTRGASGGIEGTYFSFCTPLNSCTVGATDLHSGNAVGLATTFNIQGVISNTMTSSTDSSTDTLFLGLNDGNNGWLEIFNYTATTFSFYKNCSYPGIIPYCVASTAGSTFVLYGSFFDGTFIGQLDVATCNISNLATSPVRVKGSQSGPGGQCAAVSAQNSIYWVDDASATLYQYDYVSSTLSNYTMPADFASDAFFYLYGSDNLDFLVYHAQSFTSTSNTYQIAFSNMTAAVVNSQSFQDFGVDDSVNPPNLIDFSGFGATVYSFSGQMLGTSPTLQTPSCTGGTAYAYDSHTTQYAPGANSHNGASSLSIAASLLFTTVIAVTL